MRKLLFFLFLTGYFLPIFSLSSIAQDSYTFLIQDRWGVIVGLTLDENGIVSEPEIVRGMVESPRNPQIVDLETLPSGGYQLTSDGALIPLGNASIPTTFWTPLAQTSKFAVPPDGSGMWIASVDHLKVRGSPPQMVLPPSLHHGNQVTDLEYDPANQRLVLLFEDGTISISSTFSIEEIQTLSFTNDQAIDIEIYGSQYLVLTRNAKVYLVDDQEANAIQEIPELGNGLVRDIEPSPIREGFYLLDAFGVIHACEGAPQVPTEPLLQDAAVDLEIIPLATPPKWYPSGWNTTVKIEPAELLLDPIGSSKKLSLVINQAETISGYIAELHYDPSAIRIDSNMVQVGQWWENSIQGAMVQANIDHEQGTLFLAGGGSVLPYEGASGSGEIAQIAIAAATKTQFATTTIELSNFHIRDVYPIDQYRSIHVVNSSTVTIQPIQPHIEIAWRNFQPSDSQRLAKPGEIVGIDLLIENGSRIQDLQFDVQFPKDRLSFLGMTLGDIWSESVSLNVHFDSPKFANKTGKLVNQKIQAESTGAMADQKGISVVLFFAIQGPGESKIEFQNIQARDEDARILDLNRSGMVQAVLSK